MLYIITPCSRLNNLSIIEKTIPDEAKWIICYDNKYGPLCSGLNAVIMTCSDTGFVGTKARNYVLDNYTFNDTDTILFHDDDNIIHPLLYTTINSLLYEDFSIMCWGLLNKDNTIRLYPSTQPKKFEIDTASYLIKWKYNKHIRHKTDVYYHDGQYAEDCAKNGKIYTINSFLSYYNYLS